MAVTPADVRATSITGQFAAITDAVISALLSGEVVGQYATAVSELGIRQATADRLVALHAAHILFIALKEEAGGGAVGFITAESLSRVGSRSYSLGMNGDDPGPFAGWALSPYGKRAKDIWDKLPPAMFFSLPAAEQLP